MNRRQLLAIRCITASYLALLAIATHWPGLDVSKVMHVPNHAVPLGLDKLCHVAAFASLAFLACVCRVFGRRAYGHLLTLVALLVYACIDETTQAFIPGRWVTWQDLTANASGLVLGWFCFVVMWFIAGRPTHGEGDDPGAGFAANTRLVSAFTLASRFLGLGRDWALAIALGFGAVADAFWFAFIVPNLFRRLFGEGALAAAFIPHYASLRESDPKAARRFAAQIVTRLTLVLLAITAAAIVVIGLIAALMPLDSRGQFAAEIAAATMWYMPLVCLAAILGAVLQVHQRFVVPAASPIVLNVFIIGGSLAAATFLSDWPVRDRVMVIAIAIVAAGVVQVLWHLLAIADADEGWTPVTHPRADARRHDPASGHAHRKLLAQWAPTVLGLAVFQINVLADTVIGMAFSGERGEPIGWLGGAADYPMQVGAVSVLNYAARLYEFPLGVFGIALATAIFPQLAAAAARRADFSALLRQGLRLAMFIGLPASVGLVIVRYPLARSIYYPGGAVGAEDAARVAWVLMGYAPAVWAYSINHVLTRAFYAQHDARTPLRIAMGAVALNVALNLTLIWPLGAAGLAWSTAICAIVQTTALALAIRRYSDGPIDRAVVGGWVRTAALSAVMAAAAYAVVTPFDLPALSRGGVVLVLLAASGAGAAVFLAGSAMTRAAELRWLLSRA